MPINSSTYQPFNPWPLSTLQPGPADCAKRLNPPPPEGSERVWIDFKFLSIFDNKAWPRAFRPTPVFIFYIKVKVGPAFLLLRSPEPDAGVLGAVWVAFGASWGSLGASWEGLGGLLGRCWGLLARSWDLLGRSWGLCWRKSIFKKIQDRFYDDFRPCGGTHTHMRTHSEPRT